MQPFLTQYQSANLSDDQIIDNFVVRTKEFERVMADIRTTEKGSSFQHYVFVGRRGSGKSTLLRRIQAEVATDPELNERFIVANLSEEQAGIYKLYDLWDYVIRDLRAKGFDLPEVDWQEYQDDLKEYTKVLYGAIHDLLQKEDKRLILLVDNIDRIFKNIGKDSSLLREQLMNFNDVRIIGGSTVMAEDFWRYDMPFYQFFSIKRLEPLSMEEIKMLLEHWAEARNNPEIAQFVEKHPGKIQAVRMLTDGTPRTMQLFVDMLISRDDQQGFDYLRRIIDNATPIYQERLAQLSHQQQKIVTELSFFWEAASIEQLIPVCKMTGKNISAQMAQLIKARIVEKVKGEKKNMYYRLEERFFNLWLLMTQGGPKQKREAKYLTVFLETWYDREEIRSIYEKLNLSLKQKSLQVDFAASMTKALVHCRYLTLDERDTLISDFRAFGKENSEWVNQLPETFSVIVDKVDGLMKLKNYTQAIDLIRELEQEDWRKFVFLGILLGNAGRYYEAERALRSAQELGDQKHIHMIGIALRDQGKLKEAEAHFSMIADPNNSDISFGMATVKHRLEKFQEAEMGYLAAIDHGDEMAIDGLARMYFEIQEFEKAEIYYTLGVEKNRPNCFRGLALMYYAQNIKQKEALSLIAQGQSIEPNNLDMLITYVIMDLWSGNMEGFEKNIDVVFNQISPEKTNQLMFLMMQLLIHRQYSLVIRVIKEERDTIAQNGILRLIYFVMLSIQDSSHPELELMPPEWKNQVEELALGIKLLQNFYYEEY